MDRIDPKSIIEGHEKLTELFGGATEMPPAKGKWYNEESKKIIPESVS